MKPKVLLVILNFLIKGEEKKLCLCNGIGGYKLDGCNIKKINRIQKTILRKQYPKSSTTSYATISSYTTNKVYHKTTTEVPRNVNNVTENSSLSCAISSKISWKSILPIIAMLIYL